MSAALGEMHQASFSTDPKHLAFVLARYHFVNRMLVDCTCALEIGCGDCTGAHLVMPGREWYGIDSVVYTTHMQHKGHVSIHDMVKDGPYWVPGKSLNRTRWPAIYALDVLEHIDPADEDRFFHNIRVCLAPTGMLIIGSPSLESQPYASPLSKQYHVNCKTGDGLRTTLKKHFNNVFTFGMNDCTLHTGFDPMCHYRLAICTGKR